MKVIVASFKREYWENKRIIVGLPVATGALLILAALITMIFLKKFMANIDGEYALNINSSHYSSSHYSSSEQGLDQIGSGQVQTEQEELFLDFSKNLNKYDEDASQSLFNKFSSPYSSLGMGQSENIDKGASTFLLALFAVFMGSAWFAGLYYLLGSLNNDRKDSSILFWKSLPISEMQNVMVKLSVGALGFVLVSIVVAWLTYIILLFVGLTGAFVFGVGGVAIDAIGGNVFSLGMLLQSISMPLFTAIAGLLWGAPLFTYVLMISAIAKRSPFGLLVVPPIAMIFFERVIFNSRYTLDFIVSHLPFRVFDDIAIDSSTRSLPYFTQFDVMNLILGLLVSVIFIMVSVWYRNHKFEV